MLKVENLTKKFGRNTVLDGVNLQISDGEKAGLIGSSGCGKSTLAKIICGLERPDGGNVFLNGKRLWDKNYDRSEGINIQLVYQQPFAVLDPSQKIISGFRELIKYTRAERAGDADKIIEKICCDAELDREILNRRPHMISGGEAQRIAIAKALLFKPQLLILDEATSMLDMSTQANVLLSVKRETEKIGGAVLMISHDRELVEYFCDAAYCLEKGIERII